MNLLFRNRSKMHPICWLFYPRMTSSDKFFCNKIHGTLHNPETGIDNALAHKYARGMWFPTTQHVQLHLSGSTWPLTWTGLAKLFRGSRRLTFNHLTGLDITTVMLPWHKRTWIIFKAGTKL